MVDSPYVAQLKAESLSVTVSGPQAARWPTQGIAAKGLSPFQTPEGASNEGARRAAFRGAPLVRERATVPGRHSALFGRCITLRAAQLGYAAGGERVYVMGAEELDNDTTALTVLRRLS